MCPEGATPSGIEDLAGNCWEWLEGRRENYEEETIPDGTRPIRGGAWRSEPMHLRVAYRNWVDPDRRYNYIGFRVIRDLPA
jgi:iron(II)-dependent oxidoreductase